MFAEQGNDAAVAAQYISEPHRHIFGILRPAAEHLNDHLADALRGAHHVGGIHRLVRGDQHKGLHPVPVRRLRHMICTKHVVLDRLVGAVLHQRHVLVGRGVIDNVGAVLVKKQFHLLPVPHGPDQDHQIQHRIFMPQLLLDGVGIIFINIKNDQLSGTAGGDLAAQLAADAPASPCDQHRLAPDIPGDLFHIHLDAVPAQQVLDPNLSQLLDLYPPIGNFGQRRQGLGNAAGLLTQLQNLPPLAVAAGRDGKNDLTDVVLPGHGLDVLPAAHYRHAVELHALFLHFVIDDADHLVKGHITVVQFPQDHRAGLSGADQHRPRHPAGPLLIVNHIPQQAVRKALYLQKRRQKDDVQNRKASGHRQSHQSHEKILQDPGYNRSLPNMKGLFDADKPP